MPRFRGKRGRQRLSTSSWLRKANKSLRAFRQKRGFHAMKKSQRCCDVVVAAVAAAAAAAADQYGIANAGNRCACSFLVLKSCVAQRSLDLAPRRAKEVCVIFYAQETSNRQSTELKTREWTAMFVAPSDGRFMSFFVSAATLMF